ncbi:MAG: hypothetical protein ABSG53_04380 [Thermoguttaceae bacterium]
MISLKWTTIIEIVLVGQYNPELGGRLGLNLNLTIRGKRANRGAYWPGPKMFGVTTRPDRWGTALLLE